MNSPGPGSAWTLYCPGEAGELAAFGAVSESVRPRSAEAATSSWHQDGFYLPEAEFDGWRFGLLQDALHPAGLLAFVRSRDGLEATLVSDPAAPVLERLDVAVEPGYAGAFRVALPSLVSLSQIVEGFGRVLPLLKEQFERARGGDDA